VTRAFVLLYAGLGLSVSVSVSVSVLRLAGTQTSGVSVKTKMHVPDFVSAIASILD
jgi:hypothetical protein